MPYTLDDVEHATVRDSTTFRGMWTKFITAATWRGTPLTLKATSFSDSHATADPAAVAKEREHDGLRNPTVEQVLTLGPSGSELTIVSTITDEKGEVTFAQVCKRAGGR